MTIYRLLQQPIKLNVHLPGAIPQASTNGANYNAMFLINPPDSIESALIKAVLEKTLSAATSYGWSWWQFRKKTSRTQKQSRILYTEILYNQLVCRMGANHSPPFLIPNRKEWDRPSTPKLLSKLLSPEEVILVAAPYVQMATWEWMSKQSWLEQLPLRLAGMDVKVVAQLSDQFTEAERILRPKLLPPKAQDAVAKAREEYPPPAEIPVKRQRRLFNSYHSIPAKWKLAGGLLGLGLAIDCLFSRLPTNALRKGVVGWTPK